MNGSSVPVSEMSKGTCTAHAPAWRVLLDVVVCCAFAKIGIIANNAIMILIRFILQKG